MANDNNQGKIALVTGASSGIGYALAQEFASHGYDLILCAEDAIGLEKSAGQLKGAGAKVQTVTADLSTPEGVETLYNAAKTIGTVDVLCANAGIGAYGNFSTETDLETELKLVDLNARSVVHLTKLISRDMVTRKSGKILITASMVSFVPDAYQTVYAASKAFDFIFAEGLRESLKGTGVGVTALLPGATDTDFFRRAGALDSKILEGPLADPADVAKVAYQALMDGEDHVVQGVQNKMMTAFAKLAPAPLVAAMGRKQSEPKKQAS